MKTLQDFTDFIMRAPDSTRISTGQITTTLGQLLFKENVGYDVRAVHSACERIAKNLYVGDWKLV